MNLTEKSFIELKAIATEKGIDWNGMNSKAAIIEAIEKHDAKLASAGGETPDIPPEPKADELPNGDDTDTGDRSLSNAEKAEIDEQAKLEADAQAKADAQALLDEQARLDAEELAKSEAGAKALELEQGNVKNTNMAGRILTAKTGKHLTFNASGISQVDDEVDIEHLLKIPGYTRI